MIKKFAFVCSLAAAFLVLTSAKTDKSAAKFDSSMETIMKDLNAVGIQTAVVKGDKVAFTKAYGVKDLESGEPLTTTNAFKVGLCGRVLVPVAIFQLVDNKLITTKDDISKYLGFEVRNPDFPDTPITISNLLKQVSTMTDKDGYSDGLKSIENLKPTDPAFSSIWGDGTPGKTYNKFNKGFIILAAIVEKVTGMTFAEYAQEYIFKPLHITASYTPTDFAEGVLVSSYKFKDSGYEKYKLYRKYNRDGYVPGESTFKMRVNADLMISAEDLSKIVLSLMNDGLCPLYNIRLFSAETAQKFLKPNKSEKRCSGINISKKWSDGTLFYNGTGSWGGTSGIWGFSRDLKVGFVALTNGTAEDGFGKEVREAFVEAYL